MRKVAPVTARSLFRSLFPRQKTWPTTVGMAGMALLVSLWVTGCDSGGANGPTPQPSPKPETSLQLPPDPAKVAPELSPTEYTAMVDATAFLYTGNNPIQTGMTEGTIEADRVAVVRGQVVDRANNPIPGVTITIKDHNEYGQTLSRADGWFDLAVNGGGQLTIDYEKDGYLPLQRQITTPWQDFVVADQVVMIALDPQVTTVDLVNNDTLQTAQGSEQTDGDGTRQATVLFPAGTTATMTLPDGSTQTLSSLAVRATEYTVGENGPDAMPGDLPIHSGYTYAVELSVDEAIQAGATEVTFNQPLPVYVDNFLEFPTGEAVPLGWYDREKAAWIAADNGRVIEIISVTDTGLAELDTDGDGAADSQEVLEAQGISATERIYLGETYSVGKTLWRVQVEHFTPWDCNWPYGPPADAIDPPIKDDIDEGDYGENNDDLDLNSEDGDMCKGSIVTPQGQVLGEALPITGTPFSLNYSSDRAPGYRSNALLNIPLAGDTVPTSLQKVEVEVYISGKNYRKTFISVSPNQHYEFEWDGRDAWERRVPSAVAEVTITYHYRPTYYSSPSRWQRSFNQFGDRSQVIGYRTEDTIKVSSRWRRQLTLKTPQTRVDTQLGLWNLNVHHSYNPQSEVLYKGTGEKRNAAYQGGRVTTLFSGNCCGYNGDEIPAIDAKLSATVRGLDFSSDGSLYFSDSLNYRIRKITPDGIIHTIGGTGESGMVGDDGPATDAQLSHPIDMVLGADGSVYIADYGKIIVRKITPDGTIKRFAGIPSGYTIDKDSNIAKGSGGPALDKILLPRSLALAPDGTLYIGDEFTGGVYKVDHEGNIYLILGSDKFDYEDGGPSVKAEIGTPLSLAFDQSGALYIATSSGGYQLSPSGELTQLFTQRSNSVAVDQVGDIYFGREDDDNQKVIMKRLKNGEFVTIAGGYDGYERRKFPIPSLKYKLYQDSLAFDAKGDLYAGEFGIITRASQSNISMVDDSEIFVPDANGTLSFVFHPSGKHLRTVSTTTGQSIYTFGYDDQGHLVRVTDLDGNVTQIERQADGTPTAIVAPDGQYTTLAVNADGYLASVTNPLFESHTMNYRSDGLLTQFTDPMGNSSRFTYGQNGRLISDTNAADGGWALSRSGAETTLTSGEGRKSLFSVQKRYDGSTLKVNTAPDGSETRTLMATDGSQVVTLANGTTIHTESGADPRFGMSAPVSVVTRITTPSGLVKEVVREKVAELDDENNLFSPVELVESVWINDDDKRYSRNSYQNTYSAETNTWTHTTPGRYSGITRTTDTLNDKGQLSQSKTAGIESVNYRYDDHGRLVQLDRGDNATRVTSFEYDLQGYLSRVTNARDQSIFYTNDALGRVLSQTDQNGHTVHYEYDANGNLTQLTLPSGERHQFSYTAVNQQEDYTPPAPDADATTGTVASNHPTTHYSYNLDKQLTQVLRPDGERVNYSYDSDSGQLRTLSTEAGEYTYEYIGDMATDTPTGQLNQVTAPGGQSIGYQYDGSLLTNITWSGPVSGTVGYEYNNRFEAAAQTVNGETLAMSYDKDGQLTGAGTLSIFHRSGNGLLYLTRLGDLKTELDYNAYGELATYTADYNANELYQYNLHRDESGRVTGKTETLGGTTTDYEYAYDASERLESVTENGVIVQRWGYDKNGNRTHENGSLVANYDAQNRLIGYKYNEYRYTANGELTEKTDTATNETTQFQYDAFSNLRSVTLPDSTEIEYIIDGQNRRVGKLRNGTLEQGFLYQGQLNPVAELDGSNNVTTRFVYGDKGHVPSYIIKDGTNYRIVSDHLGSVRLVVNAGTGEVAQRMDYDAWGNVTNDTNPGFQPFGYAGGIYDRDTGLTRFGARDYDPEVGRWTTKDPIGFGGGLNHYAYVAGNPINLIDTTGNAFNFITGGVGALIGGVYGGVDAFMSGESVKWGISKGAATGGLAGLTFGSSLAVQAASGLAIGVAADVAINIGEQAVANGGLPCVDYSESAVVALSSALLGGLGSSFGKAFGSVYSNTELAETIIGGNTSGSTGLLFNAATGEYH